MDCQWHAQLTEFVAELGLELSSLEWQGIELSAAWEERML